MDVFDYPALVDRIEDLTQNRRIRLQMLVACNWLDEADVLKFLDTVKERDAEFDGRYTTWRNEDPQQRSMSRFMQMIISESQ